MVRAPCYSHQCVISSPAALPGPCDLLLIHRIWWRWCDGSSEVRLQKTVTSDLLAALSLTCLAFLFWWKKLPCGELPTWQGVEGDHQPHSQWIMEALRPTSSEEQKQPTAAGVRLEADPSLSILGWLPSLPELWLQPWDRPCARGSWHTETVHH